MLLAQYVCCSDGAMIFIFRYVYGSNNKGSWKSCLITQFTVHKVIWLVSVLCPKYEHEILNLKTVWLKMIGITPWYQCMTVYTLHRFLTFTAINGEEVELRLTAHYVSINILPFCFNIYILLLHTFPSNAFKVHL